jgi:hypothetical protein
MEHPAFESPLSDEQLKELGRLVVNTGFAEFLFNMHVGMLHKIPHAARIVLVNPLALRRKVDILTNGLDQIPGSETRTLVDEACKLVGAAIAERNLLLHGIWGVDADRPDAKPLVAATTKASGIRYPADITKYADMFAIASRKLKHAITIDSGGKVTDEAERLVIVPG